MNFNSEVISRESLRSILREGLDPIPEAHRLRVYIKASYGTINK